MQPDRPTPAAPPRRGFFSLSHRCIWTPGVRLFQRLRFSAKAVLISAVFLVPIALLLAVYLRGVGERIAFARAERGGVVVMDALDGWRRLAERERDALLRGEPQTGEPSPTAALEAAANRAREVVSQRPFGLDLRDAMQRAQAAAGALPPPDAPPAARLAALVRQLDAWQRLRVDALDASGLTLDPDQDTYYLMSVATAVAPDAGSALAQAAALGAALARDGADAAALRQALQAPLALARERLPMLTEHVARAAKGHPALAGRLQPAAAVAAAQAWVDAAEAAWLGAAAQPRAELVAGAAPLAAALQRLGADATRLLDERLQARIDAAASARAAMLVATLAALLLAGYLFLCFFHVMDDGLGEVGRHLRAMARGDLTTTPRAWGSDEIAQLIRVLTEMQDALRGMVRQVRDASDGIVVASGGIASGAKDLAARTERTSSSLEASATAMDGIANAARQSADHTEEATRLAAQNAEIAARGGQVIGQMVSTMEDIHASSRRIAEIIGVIDGIAFQTNLLALNAAVEAARAGEQGRGFAVVAGEVRALARRSADAAQQIKGLISKSVDQVHAGSGIVRDAGATIAEIVGSAQRVSALLDAIAGGARAQRGGVEQVGDAVQTLDRMTQANATLVGQAVAASDSLNDEAQTLAREVARFRLPPAQPRQTVMPPETSSTAPLT